MNDSSKQKTKIKPQLRKLKRTSRRVKTRPKGVCSKPRPFTQSTKRRDGSMYLERQCTSSFCLPNRLLRLSINPYCSAPLEKMHPNDAPLPFSAKWVKLITISCYDWAYSRSIVRSYNMPKAPDNLRE